MKSYKEKTIKITSEKQEKILKEALSDIKKYGKEFGMKSSSPKQREEKIEDIYEIEKLEKQLEK